MAAPRELRSLRRHIRQSSRASKSCTILRRRRDLPLTSSMSFMSGRESMISL